MRRLDRRSQAGFQLRTVESLVSRLQSHFLQIPQFLHGFAKQCPLRVREKIDEFLQQSCGRRIQHVATECPAELLIADLPLLRIRLEYEVYRGEELLATGSTVHAFVDRSGRPVRPPPARRWPGASRRSWRASLRSRSARCRP